MNRKSWSTLLGTMLILSAAACSGADDANTEADAPAAEAPATTSAETPAATPPATSSIALPAGVTQEMVAAGQSQWSGAICTSCHGPEANGTVLAPSLRDAEWLNSDGSYEGIVKTINEGVAQPKKFTAAMPPKGGAALSEQQVNELAAYVYSISHGG